MKKKTNEMLTTFVREDNRISEGRPEDFGAMVGMFTILLVLAAMAVYYYGPRAAAVAAVCVAVCWASDTVCLIMRRKALHLHDLSPIITGLTLAVMMPASVSYKAAAAAAVFAVCIAKHPFGGHGHEIFNCAAAGYIFAELSFPQTMRYYPRPFAELPILEPVTEGLSPSFTRTLLTSGTTAYSDFELLIGNFTGPMGCTCTVLVIVCALVLISRRCVSPAVFFGELGTVLIYGFIRSGAQGIKLSLISGMLVFSTAILTADLSTAPKKTGARLIFGILAGLITVAASRLSALEAPAVYACIIAAPIGKSLDGSDVLHRRHRRKRVKSIFGADNAAADNDVIGDELDGTASQ